MKQTTYNSLVSMVNLEEFTFHRMFILLEGLLHSNSLLSYPGDRALSAGYIGSASFGDGRGGCSTLSPLKRKLGEGAVVYCPLGLEAIRV